VKDAGEASLSDKRQMVEDFFKGSKIVIDWPDQHTDAADVPVSSRIVRMLFNLLIITSGALLKGGTLAIRVTEEAGGKCLSVSANGEAVKWDGENESILLGRGNFDDMTPKTVQVYMTAKLAEELHVKFDIAASASGVTIKAVQPPSHTATTDMSETSHG